MFTVLQGTGWSSSEQNQNLTKNLFDFVDSFFYCVPACSKQHRLQLTGVGAGVGLGVSTWSIITQSIFSVHVFVLSGTQMRHQDGQRREREKDKICLVHFEIENMACIIGCMHSLQKFASISL
jgi:hypothetical protein